MAPAEQRLNDLLGSLLRESAAAGHIGHDVLADELARYCVHALGGMGEVGSEAAVQRLVAITIAALTTEAA